MATPFEYFSIIMNTVTKPFMGNEKAITFLLMFCLLGGGYYIKDKWQAKAEPVAEVAEVAVAPILKGMSAQDVKTFCNQAIKKHHGL